MSVLQQELGVFTPRLEMLALFVLVKSVFFFAAGLTFLLYVVGFPSCSFHNVAQSPSRPSDPLCHLFRRFAKPLPQHAHTTCYTHALPIWFAPI